MTGLKRIRKKVEYDAIDQGYYLNPNKGFLSNLLEGLKKNEARYGYFSCPCRLASGKLEFDKDIICPCDYRDQDIEEYGCCYCALFVNKETFEGRSSIKPIPERRPLTKQIRADSLPKETSISNSIEIISKERVNRIMLKLYYCKQCGYVCFREEPPYICPICRAKKEMFAIVISNT